MNFRQVTICAAAALLAAAAGCRAHAPACNLPFEMPQVARPAIPSNTVSVADFGGSGGGDAGTGYAMTLSVTAGVLSPNITACRPAGLPATVRGRRPTIPGPPGSRKASHERGAERSAPLFCRLTVAEPDLQGRW